MLSKPLVKLGKKTLAAIEDLGNFTEFCISAMTWLIFGARKPGRFRLLMPQLYNIGTRSSAVVVLVGAFVGMVLAVEAYDQFAAIGQQERLGGVINISVVKQIGPVLAAVMIAGRVGGSVSAELGTMNVTEQLDALRVMGADPIDYLVVPRVLACLIMIPILTIFSDITGVLGGYIVTCKGFGVSSDAYWEFSRQFVGDYDVWTGLSKSAVFALAIGLVSCYKGFTCKAGAAGVGRAATESFVTSFIIIIIANFFLAKFFKDLYGFLYGDNGFSAFG